MPTLCSCCAMACYLLPARDIRACLLLRIRSSGHRRPCDGRSSSPRFVRQSGVASSCLLQSTNSATCCGSCSVLCSSDVATCGRRVPRAPLCGSLRQCDRPSGTSNKQRRYHWLAVNTLASLTRQDNNSSRKQIQSKQKLRIACTLCFRRKASTKGEHGTLQCSAGPEWYGCHGTFGTLTRQSPLGASQHAKKVADKFCRNVRCLRCGRSVSRVQHVVAHIADVLRATVSCRKLMVKLVGTQQTTILMAKMTLTIVS